MKRILCLLALWLACFGYAATPQSEALSDDALAQIRFEQNLNQQIPTALRFRDETGKVVALGDYFGRRPVILVLGYYRCPMLCSLTLNGLIEAMQDIKLEVGRDFDILNVSIDPQESPALAIAKKNVYLKRYGRKDAAAGWHFLTGNEAEIRQLSNVAGFRYLYDPVSREYAHPSGLIILTPEARISHYMFGVTYSPSDLATNLRDAEARRVGSAVQQFFLLCFHYNPISGKYGAWIMSVVRFFGMATLAGLSYLVFCSRPRWPERRREAGR